MSLEFILDLFLPKFCLGCQKPGSFICFACQTKITFTSKTLCPICEEFSPLGKTHKRCRTFYGIDGMIVCGDYYGILKIMIHALKYKNVYSLSEILVKLLVNRLPIPQPNFDLITPIPLHPKRLKERGYNQAAILAKSLAKSLNLKYTRVSL